MSTATELDVLAIVGERLEALGRPYMLTGSFALAYYATPRMTRDLDLVVELSAGDVAPLVAAFERDFYVDAEAASQAVATRRLFNLMHLGSGVKIDLVVRKDEPYRRTEFARRTRVELGSASIWIVSREDLVLSKLAWARKSGSELQRRDVRALLEDAEVDAAYLRRWAPELGVADSLEDALRG